MDINFSKLWEMVKVRETWHAAVHGVTKRQTQVSDWATTTEADQLGSGRTENQVEAVWRQG